MTQNKYMLAQS